MILGRLCAAADGLVLDGEDIMHWPMVLEMGIEYELILVFKKV